MKTILNYVWDYRFIILVVVAVIMYAIFRWSDFKSKAYAIMLQAKTMAKDEILKTGKDQADWAADKLYSVIPARYKMFISQDKVRSLVEYLYLKGKDFLDDGKLNNSVK